MATEVDAPITTKALAEFVVTQPAEKVVDAFVDQLARTMPAALPLLVARAVPLRKTLQYVEKIAEERIAADRILKFGGEWVDPDAGVLYTFSGEQQDWKVTDPDGFVAALIKAKAPKERLERAAYKVWKFNHTEINALCEISPEIREVVDDFRSRGFAPAHLKEKK